MKYTKDCTCCGMTFYVEIGNNIFSPKKHRCSADGIIKRIEKEARLKRATEEMRKIMKDWDGKVICAKSPITVEEYPPVKPNLTIMDYPDRL